MNKDRSFDWRAVNDKAQSVLGDEFWTEINKVLPKRGPNIDAYKTDSSFKAFIEIPGVSSADEINIRIKNYKLVVSGKVPWIYPVQEKEMLQKERFTGEFKRELSLPNDIDTKGKIDARYRNGIIEINIPLRSDEDEKEIPVGFEE